MEFSSVNTIWVLLAAALVFFMQAGFAMVETGFTRAKNAGNIIMKNLMDFSIGTSVFWLLGFGIMFGSSNQLFGGFDLFQTQIIQQYCQEEYRSSHLLFFRQFFAQQLQQLFPEQWLKEQNLFRTVSTV